MKTKINFISTALVMLVLMLVSCNQEPIQPTPPAPTPPANLGNYYYSFTGGGVCNELAWRDDKGVWNYKYNVYGGWGMPYTDTVNQVREIWVCSCTSPTTRVQLIAPDGTYYGNQVTGTDWDDTSRLYIVK